MLQRLSSSLEEFFSFPMRIFFNADHTYLTRGNFSCGFFILQKLSIVTWAPQRFFSFFARSFGLVKRLMLCMGGFFVSICAEVNL